MYAKGDGKNEGPLSKFIRKTEESEKLTTQLVSMFQAWDCEVGGESSLNCLDVTTAVHKACNIYINAHEERMMEEN